MNIVKNEIKARDRIIAEMRQANAVMGNALAAKDKIIAAMEKENAELRRRYGLN